MLLKVIDTIKKYNMLSQNDKVVVGLSGGSDSVALLYVLLKIKDLYNLDIFAVHINHGIRGDAAKKDENFVRELCIQLSTPLSIYNFNIAEEAKKLKISEEETGRILRYESFQEVLKQTGSNKIAIAHNLNDCSETMILNFFRGTGLRGLRGIPPVRENIIRPLINIEKKEIDNFCEENSIKYIVDNTNALPIYTRNKIRGQLIPYVEKEVNQNIVSTLHHMSINFSEEEDYLNNQALDAFKQCIIDHKEAAHIIKISINKTNAFPTPIKKRILRICISKLVPHLKDISNDHIDMLVNLLDKKTGKKVNLPMCLVGELEYDNLVIYKKNAIDTGFCYDAIVDKPIYIKEINKYLFLTTKKLENHNDCVCTKIICHVSVKDMLKFRTYHVGDKIFFNSIDGNKKLKDFFRDKKISKIMRDNLPLLAIDSEIICIFMENEILSDKYKTDDHTSNQEILYIYLICKRKKYLTM